MVDAMDVFNVVLLFIAGAGYAAIGIMDYNGFQFLVLVGLGLIMANMALIETEVLD